MSENEDRESQLLVLRFRDLSVEPGDSIRLHRKTIASHGSCWWGWWSRDLEQDPSGVLGHLTTPRTVALYHTDQRRIYASRCLGIETYPNKSLSPNANQTPDYYNPRSLRAWFKLTDIIDSDPSLVLGRRCTFTAAEGKVADGPVIVDLSQLRRMETTMWILES
jgi:hypothetical protein